MNVGHHEHDWSIGPTGNDALAPVRVTIRASGFDVHNYLTPAEARTLAGELLLVAQQVELAQEVAS